MRFVLDFDHTVFDTGALWDFWRDALMAHGHDEAVIRATANEIIPVGFTPRSHAQRLGLTNEVMENVVASLARFTQEHAPRFVFKDVLPFVKARTPVSILTFGNPQYQREKIEASGIHQHIDDIRIAQDYHTKAKHLRALIDEGIPSLTFIDDSPDELAAVHETGLPVTLVRMKRPGLRRSTIDHPLDHSAWKVIETLVDL